MRTSDTKTRADNFSEEDKALLLSLIADHVAVLECRKTDHKYNTAKYKAWADISKNFHCKASHPRNFTQMKDLYRRLKLKAKKEVGLWLKACAESGTGKPLPGSQVVQPDNTSFWIYDLIKPYKEELLPEDEEQERLLAEAIKERDLSESFPKPEEDAIEDDHENDLDAEPALKSEMGEDENIEEEAEDSPDVKEELDFDYVPPGVVTAATETPSDTVEVTPKPRPERVQKKTKSRQRWSPSTAPSTFTDPSRRQKRSYPFDPTNKRRRVFPHSEQRRYTNSTPSRPERFNSVFNRGTCSSWSDSGSSFSREPAMPVPSRHQMSKEDATEGMSAYEEAMFQLAQAEHKAKMLVLQTQRRAETAKEEAYKMIWQNSQLQRDLLQLQYENVL